ncbi:MAG: alpha/beta fold hydrolase [Phenylobacterium sp.]|uniref:alpha/beta fold hydrolase n=1 Tax=Phenylobacterium sp. TaxID=1871053 RepID=UPI0025F2D745|nr:alpha/beta hydrolase [Phenylobacterium sp.]MBI1197363.1 alpha/beta fold hydrolase [Phenylobacterium sp.]
MNSLTTYEPRARRIELPARGGAMAVLDFGPPDRPVDVVFSHANGFNARTYRTILAPLAPRLRVLALDLRGHGGSTLPAVVEDHGGWNQYRDDLLALLAAETEGPVVLAGHSMGATTCLLAAAVEPARVKALALFDPVLFDHARAAREQSGDNPLAQGADRRRAVFPDKAAAAAAYTGRGAFRSWSPEQLADYVEGGFRDTADGQVTLSCAPAWEASNFRIHGYDAWAAIRAIRRPVRMLRAETGSTARIDDNLEELAANPQLTVETVPGTTHFLPMERPDIVRAVIGDLAGG